MRRRVITWAAIVIIFANGYVATNGPWWVQPFALFVALALTHVLTVFVYQWHEQDKMHHAHEFMRWMIAQQTQMADDDSDDDDLRVH